MNIWERLCGAVITGLTLASLMAQAEAFAGTGKTVDLVTDIDTARAMLTEDIIVLGYPEQGLVNHLTDPAREIERH